MTKEKETLTKFVDKLICNGALDELIASSLETNLEMTLDDLKRIVESPHVTPGMLEDYLNHLSLAKALLRVLRDYTRNDYYHQKTRLELYEKGVY